MKHSLRLPKPLVQLLLLYSCLPPPRAQAGRGVASLLLREGGVN